MKNEKYLGPKTYQGSRHVIVASRPPPLSCRSPGAGPPEPLIVVASCVVEVWLVVWL
jgi:hypothetical protein